MKKLISFYLLLVSIFFCLTSCSKEIEREYNKIYIDSFDYEVTMNEVASSISYLFSFDIDFSTKETSTNRELSVRITGLQNRSSVYSLNDCNTENVSVSQNEESYYARMTYTIAQGDMAMKASGTFILSTTTIMDDINDFVKIECFNRLGCEVVDYSRLMEQGTFKMNYPTENSGDKIFYKFDEWTESYQVVSVHTKSNYLEIPAYHNDYPIQTINEVAFKDVTSIETLVLPTTLTYLSKGLLSSMSKLKVLSLPFVGSGISGDGHSYFGYLFGASSSNENIEYVPKSLEEVVLTGPSPIENDAFYGCSGIKKIVLKNDITSIGDFAFSSCRNLNTIELSENLISIGKMTFYGCSMTSIILPKTIENIGDYAFYQCNQLAEVYYRGTEAEWDNIIIGNYHLELNAARKYYYSSTKPMWAGHYWHYVDGVVTKW